MVCRNQDVGYMVLTPVALPQDAQAAQSRLPRFSCDRQAQVHLKRKCQEVDKSEAWF